MTVNDPSGHGSKARASIPVRSTGPLIGIRPAFPDDAVDAGREAAFDVVALKPDGTRTALAAHMRLVRERPDWRIVRRGGIAHYETVFRDEPVQSRDVTIPADGTLRVAQTLDFGRYRIEVAQADGMAATSYRFRSGWASSESPDVPDRVDVSADRKAVRGRGHRAHPRRGPVRRRGDAAGAVRPRPFAAHAGRSRGRHGRGRAGGRQLGPGRLRGGARVPRRLRQAGRPPAEPRHRRRVGRRRPGRPHPGDDHRGGREIRAPRPRRRFGQDGAGRVGDARGGGRGHPAADQLPLARPGAALPRAPHPGDRHPRRLGTADPAGRRRGHAAAPGRRRPAASRCPTSRSTR